MPKPIPLNKQLQQIEKELTALLKRVKDMQKYL